MKIAGYQYQSCFGTFIEEFIREKKEAGFVFIEAYIPCRFYKKAKKVVHVLPNDKIKDLFRIIDEYRPAIQVSFFYRLSMEYRVIFRLIYCCGLRISEARTLKQEDVDLFEYWKQRDIKPFCLSGR